MFQSKLAASADETLGAVLSVIPCDGTSATAGSAASVAAFLVSVFFAALDDVVSFAGTAAGDFRAAFFITAAVVAFFAEDFRASFFGLAANPRVEGRPRVALSRPLAAAAAVEGLRAALAAATAASATFFNLEAETLRSLDEDPAVGGPSAGGASTGTATSSF